MNWIGRKIHLYNVTMGLYMLDWWERYIFNILMIILLWFILYNGSRSATEFYNRSTRNFSCRFKFLAAGALMHRISSIRCHHNLIKLQMVPFDFAKFWLVLEFRKFHASICHV